METTLGEKAIVVIGTLDTKGDQIAYLRNLIEERGHLTITMDVGAIGEVPFEPNISRAEVAAASGSKLSDIIALSDGSKAMAKMAEGACKLVRELHSGGCINGILAIGGSMGTSLALEVARSLPLGVPKVILSTIAYSEMITPDQVDTDVMMVPWVAGLWGVNRLSDQSLRIAVGAITGAAESIASLRDTEKPVVAVNSVGQRVCWFLTELKPALEKRGYEVAVFHATGMSGRILERAISEGSIKAVLDLMVGNELISEITGGIGSSGRFRLEAASKMGIPQIVSPGAIEVFGWWRRGKPLPVEYKYRPQRPYNELITVFLSSIEERRAVARLMASKLNKAVGPTAVVIPMNGLGGGNKPEFCSRGAEEDLANQFLSGVFSASVGLVAFREELERHLKPTVKVIALKNVGINDSAYVETVLALFDEMVK